VPPRSTGVWPDLEPPHRYPSDTTDAQWHILDPSRALGGTAVGGGRIRRAGMGSGRGRRHRDGGRARRLRHGPIGRAAFSHAVSVIPSSPPCSMRRSPQRVPKWSRHRCGHRQRMPLPSGGCGPCAAL